MSRDLSEIQKIIELSFDWQVKQWEILSKHERQTHTAKSNFAKNTLSKFILLNKDKKNIVNKKELNDSQKLKAFFLILIFSLVLNLVSSFVFENPSAANFFKWVSFAAVIGHVIDTAFVQVNYKISMSAISSLTILFERDLYACNLSHGFIQKYIRHKDIFDDDNLDEFEKLLPDQKERLFLISRIADFCIFVSILRAFCSSDEITKPPREIDHDGVFFESK